MTELVPPAGHPGVPPPESRAVPAGGNAAAPAVVDGVDLDAVAAAARSCPAIDDLSAGAWGGVVSYLPGRQVAGVRVASDHVVISVRGRWGVPVREMARQVRTAVAGRWSRRGGSTWSWPTWPALRAKPRLAASRGGGLVDDEQSRRRARREFIRTHHPDRGGDPDAFAAGLAAYDRLPRPAPSRPDSGRRGHADGW